jgi:hypothetical protein
LNLNKKIIVFRQKIGMQSIQQRQADATVASPSQ